MCVCSAHGGCVHAAWFSCGGMGGQGATRATSRAVCCFSVFFVGRVGAAASRCCRWGGSNHFSARDGIWWKPSRHPPVLRRRHPPWIRLQMARAGETLGWVDMTTSVSRVSLAYAHDLVNSNHQAHHTHQSATSCTPPPPTPPFVHGLQSDAANAPRCTGRPEMASSGSCAS